MQERWLARAAMEMGAGAVEGERNDGSGGERKKRDRNRQGRLRPAVGPLLLCGEDGAAAMAPVAAQASVHEKGREEGWRRRGRHRAAREEGAVLRV